MTTIYLSGPMTGLPDYNRPAFHAAEDRLRADGCEVLNPARTQGAPDWNWHDWMRAAIALQVRADVIHMLPGWSQSSGARAEHMIAGWIGQRVEGAAS